VPVPDAFEVTLELLDELAEASKLRSTVAMTLDEEWVRCR